MWNRALSTVLCTFCRPLLQIEARNRGNRNPTSATTEATLPEKIQGAWYIVLSSRNSRVPDLMMWLTWWHDDGPWQSSVTRKFSNLPLIKYILTIFCLRSSLPMSESSSARCFFSACDFSTHRLPLPLLWKDRNTLSCRRLSHFDAEFLNSVSWVEIYWDQSVSVVTCNDIIFIVTCYNIKTNEPPSKSIVDAWYENIGYRFFWGPYRFTVFCSNKH